MLSDSDSLYVNPITYCIFAISRLPTRHYAVSCRYKRDLNPRHKSLFRMKSVVGSLFKKTRSFRPTGHIVGNRNAIQEKRSRVKAVSFLGTVVVFFRPVCTDANCLWKWPLLASRLMCPWYLEPIKYAPLYLSILEESDFWAICFWSETS